jgi:hypothetical protein
MGGGYLWRRGNDFHNSNNPFYLTVPSPFLTKEAIDSLSDSLTSG